MWRRLNWDMQSEQKNEAETVKSIHNWVNQQTCYLLLVDPKLNLQYNHAFEIMKLSIMGETNEGSSPILWFKLTFLICDMK